MRLSRAGVYNLEQFRGYVIDNILIVSSQEQAITSFVGLLKNEGCNNIASVRNGNDAKRACSENEFSLIIINTPLSDGFGDELALYLLKNTGAAVMLTVKNDLEVLTENKLLPFGAFVLGKPLNKFVFHKSLHFIAAAQNRIAGVRSENVRLQKKVEDSRIINRAKCILMEYLSMSEPQAHRYIEKQAMDLRLTKAEVAKNLLITYDS